MNPAYLPFVLAAAMGLVAWGVVSRRFLWPALRDRDLFAAAEPLLYLHLFRYIGLAFVSPGVVGPGLARGWAATTAYGDVAAAFLAGACLLAGRRAALRPLLWAFNVWGTLDLLGAVALGPVYEIVPSLQATYFIPTVGVPLLLWTHLMIFALLLRPREEARPGVEIA